MNNRNNMWPLMLGIVAIIAIVAWVVVRHNDQQAANEAGTTSAFGNVINGVSDKIDQATNQAKADASQNSANANFDAAKEKLGIDNAPAPAEGPDTSGTDVE